MGRPSNYADNIYAAMPQGRVRAVDLFRGFSIAAMILVNNPGSWQYVYAPLRHAEWHGWAVTDLIFPFFVFAMGLSVSLSIPLHGMSGQQRLQTLKKGSVRAGKLILLGWLLALFFYNFADPGFDWWRDQLGSIRVFGVLQRLGLVYICCLCILLYLNQRGRLLFCLVSLLGYWLLLLYQPYSDGAGQSYRGELLPGNNLAAFVDNTVLPARHLYYADARPFAYDPEGLLSTLPAVVSCVLAATIGCWIGNWQNHRAVHSKLIAAGLVCVLCGLMWAQFFPVNKTLWTSSYVLFSSGAACLLLAALSFCLQQPKIQSSLAWLAVFGGNSIFAFMLAGVVARILLMIPTEQGSAQSWLYQQWFAPAFGALPGSALYGVSILLLCYLLIYPLHRRGLFFRI